MEPQMEPQWKDYKYGSWLVLVFGKVDAKIVHIDGDPDGSTAFWGIITHPGGVMEIAGSLDSAKVLAEAVLRSVLTEGLAALNTAAGIRTAGQP